MPLVWHPESMYHCGNSGTSTHNSLQHSLHWVLVSRGKAISPPKYTFSIFVTSGHGGVGETSKHLGQNRRVRVRMKSCLRSECWASAIPRSGKPSLIMTKTSGKCAYQKPREGGARKSTLRHRHRLGQGVQEAELTTVQPKRQSTPGQTLS